MRRFINSTAGRLVGFVTAVALALPFFSFVTISSTAYAQAQVLPTWAVVEFVNNKPQGMANLGAVAAEAFQAELSKAGQVDVVPSETVARNISSLGLNTPVTERTSLIRLANECGASTIVRGEVKNWRVVKDGTGKRADVIYRVEAIDAASGLGVNGAALQTSSSVRSQDTDDATVIGEALASAAAQAVRVMRGQTLPTATILNTINDSALMNQGSRSGFKQGQDLIILRGRQQVAVGRVDQVEPDGATLKIINQQLGVQPGDRVRAVVAPPDIKSEFTANGGVVVAKPNKPRKPGSSFGTVAIILGIAVFLSTGSRSKSFTPASKVTAEAMLFPDSSGVPAVRISWVRDTFVRGNSQTVEWQIFRDDVLGSPVMVAPGTSGQAVDNNIGRDVTWGDYQGFIGGSTCRFTDNPTTTTLGVAGVIPGRAYQFSVALVYRIAEIDLPGGSTAGNTATATASGTATGTGTATATGSGTATATTTGTGTGTGTATGGNNTTTGGNLCYFISQHVAAKGLATPLTRPQLQSPTSNANVSGDIPFTFSSVVDPLRPTTIEYVLQVSNNPTFPSGSKVLAKVQRSDPGLLSTGVVSGLLSKLNSSFPGATEFWWRIGARNVADRPGPVPDASGQRYVFGEGRRFTIPAPPPPPPAE